MLNSYFLWITFLACINISKYVFKKMAVLCKTENLLKNKEVSFSVSSAKLRTSTITLIKWKGVS